MDNIGTGRGVGKVDGGLEVGAITVQGFICVMSVKSKLAMEPYT